MFSKKQKLDDANKTEPKNTASPLMQDGDDKAKHATTPQNPKTPKPQNPKNLKLNSNKLNSLTLYEIQVKVKLKIESAKSRGSKTEGHLSVRHVFEETEIGRRE